MNTIPEGSFVILQHKESELIVVGKVSEEFKNQLGASSLLTLEWVSGLPIESGIFNTNVWSILGDRGYTQKDPEWPLVRLISDTIKKGNR